MAKSWKRNVVQIAAYSCTIMVRYGGNAVDTTFVTLEKRKGSQQVKVVVAEYVPHKKYLLASLRDLFRNLNEVSGVETHEGCLDVSLNERDSRASFLNDFLPSVLVSFVRAGMEPEVFTYEARNQDGISLVEQLNRFVQARN